jgi:KDO2-lipid IV(A) lauroyltransferase
MPFPLLYAFSDFLFFILFRVVGYRRKVVLNNLKNAFPEKGIQELRKIEKKFYKHFCDLIVESIKGFTISEKEALKRMTYTNTEILDDLAKKNKSITFIGGHFGNWELLAVTISQTVPHTVKALYTPLKGEYWDNKITTSRSRFGLKMFKIQEIKALRDSLKGELSGVIFGSDQSPSNPQKAYWVKFLNQDTGVQFGAEKNAKDFDTAIIYGAITKKKRGYYNTELVQLFEDVKDLEYGAIIESFSEVLEEKIKENPQYYLWTHRRWKHKLPEGMSLGQKLI